VFVVGAAIWSFYTGRVADRVLAATSGFAAGMLMVIYSLGGRISAFRW
jgi:hypothetical protein